jgi:hypothetical protein
MRAIIFLVFIFCCATTPTFAEKLSFKSADLHLSVPKNFEKVSDGISAETLIVLRVKGKPPTPQCSIAFSKDSELGNLSNRQIETVIDQMTGEMFASMMSQSTPIFRSARVLESKTTYWSGHKALRMKFNVDLKYMGVAGVTGRGFYDLVFTANKRGIYGANCGHTDRKKASIALDELHRNIIIGAF